jgi:hypothetical protein
MKSIIAALSLFILSFAVLALTLRGEWGNPNPSEINSSQKKLGSPFESSMARGRYAQTMALVEDKTADLRNGKEVIAMPDLGFYNGKMFPLFAPGLAFYSVPAYVIGSWFEASLVGVFLFGAVIAALNTVLIFVILKHYNTPPWASWFAGFAYLFATTAFPYAVTLAQHNFTVFFMLLVILSGIMGRKKPWLYAIGWLAYALAIFMDYPNLVLLFPAVGFMLLSAVSISDTSQKLKLRFKMAVVYAGIFFALFNLAHAYYNAEHFGAPQTIGPSVYKRINSDDELLAAKSGALVTGSNSQVSGNGLSLFDAKKLANGLFILTVSKGRGIIVFAPLTLLGILGINELSKKKKSRNFSITLGLLIITNFILYGAFGDPWGGSSYGPRYLIISMAMLSIGLGASFAHFRSIYYRILAFILFCYGAAINTVGVLTTNQLLADIEAIYRGLPYTYVWNFGMLENGLNSSLAYNTWFKSLVPSQGYAIFILFILMLVAYMSLIISPIVLKDRVKP